jgi:taurine transport system permease protein
LHPQRLGETVTKPSAASVPEGQMSWRHLRPASRDEVATGWEWFSHQSNQPGWNCGRKRKPVGASALSALPSILIYVAIILLCMFVYRAPRLMTRDHTSLKTGRLAMMKAVRS